MSSCRPKLTAGAGGGIDDEGARRGAEALELVACASPWLLSCRDALRSSFDKRSAMRVGGDNLCPREVDEDLLTRP